MQFTPTVDCHESLLSLLARRWHDWRESRETFAGLESCGPSEVARMAHDLSLTTSELRVLAGRGSGSASLLYRRMENLGLDRDALARRDPKTLRDLQKECSLCNSKARCRNDLARGAYGSAWPAYCPNAQTLSTLVGAGSSRARKSALAAALAHHGERGRNATLLPLLFIVLAWIALLSLMPADLPRMPDVTVPPATTEAALEPAVTCIDAGCVGAEQRSALESLRRVQAQGLLASSAADLAALPQASRIAQRIRDDEAFVCARQGGVAYYGFMFQQGCANGPQAAAKLEGYDECRPMAAGGACLLR